MTINFISSRQTFSFCFESQPNPVTYTPHPFVLSVRRSLKSKDECIEGWKKIIFKLKRTSYHPSIHFFANTQKHSGRTGEGDSKYRKKYITLSCDRILRALGKKIKGNEHPYLYTQGATS